MPGFACIVAEQKIDEAFNFPITALSPLQISQKNGPGYAICRYVTAKFERDKVFAEDDDVLVVIDGAILNFRDLRRRLDAPDYFQTVKELYQTNGDEFFRDFRGEFSGLLHDKRADKWLVFTNHTGMKPVFYFTGERGLACATDLVVLSRLLRSRGWQYSLDLDAAYFLLTYGFMLEDYTLLKEIRKLRPGQYLKYHDGAASLHTYHELRNDVLTRDGVDDILDTMDRLFRQAVSAEYDKDLEYGYRHLAHISGGMDAKISCFAAHELGYRRIVNLTFSQTGHQDETVSKRMASDLGNEFLFYSLDNGDFLTTTLEDEVQANGGLVTYTGGAHALSAYRYLNFEPFGGIHSGQVGSAYFVWAALPGTHHPEPSTYAQSKLLLDRVAPLVRRLQSKYDSVEIYKYMNRACNCTVNGDWVGNQYSEVMSPFTDVNFLSYVLSVPANYRVRPDFEEMWFLRKHPRAARYPRTKTGFPIGTPAVLVGARRYARGLRKRLLGEWSSCSMNPFDYWWRANPRLRAYFQAQFDQHIGLLDDQRELQEDSRRLFDAGTMAEKGQVLTLLEAVKVYFGG